MCGICGIYTIHKNQLNHDKKVRMMTEALVHRGPDEQGYYVIPEISLGVRRLKIIDLVTGSQPLFNEDKSIVVICNGEIYNYRELRKKLELKGHIFYTNTDVEVIVHNYEEKGDDFHHAGR